VWTRSRYFEYPRPRRTIPTFTGGALLTSAAIPVAQYVRASTERQQYSIDYQSKIISQYASAHGFEVVKTFSDEARSGLDLRYRPALRQLLAEVMGGLASFRLILVFDVSRWGRFQDTDEAAHYEYVCKSAGIPIHYCAEQFSNEGRIADSLLKTLKRFMAGEFSRDLSERAAGGLNNIVTRGFKYGSVPGYGLRRMLVGSHGRPKQLLAPGELKNISSDRVVLVPGPPEERAVVQEIYRKYAEERKSMRQIVRDLNEQKIPWTSGSKWTPEVVKRILSHPKYVGTLIFNRTEKKLHARSRPTPKGKWITIPNAFEAIVHPRLFAAAQARLASFPRQKSNEQLIDDIRTLLRKEGRLSLPLMRQTRLRRSLGVASPTTYFNRLGSVSRIFQLAGYEPSITNKCRAQTVALRKKLMQHLIDYFPNEIHPVRGKDKYLIFGDGAKVVIRICRSFTTKGGRRWMMGGCDGSSITLAAAMNEENTDVERLYLLRTVPSGRYWLAADSPLLSNGVRLNGLADFCDAVRAIKNRHLPAFPGRVR
jgi:DNA invertase Pin-like site-specific DNA recombinase